VQLRLARVNSHVEVTVSDTGRGEARQMQEPARRIPAAALTAYARSQNRITSLASGFHMHLVKPIDPLELVVAVATLAAQRLGT
jgi:CheY-like chemotaxis protein